MIAEGASCAAAHIDRHWQPLLCAHTRWERTMNQKQQDDLTKDDPRAHGWVRVVRIPMHFCRLVPLPPNLGLSRQ